ncbi:MAG: TetR family transcriptional regulator [Candidatus Sphingomonas phytovorans]|nr:TetR family transcriptional regulator [Sphingomonas sp.]WEK02252.1 MAG: TetR family transcriptional regulator [Sphingomonas sp.]
MGKADETRRRLLEAATAEFADHGIAGARVERIAVNAGCNKQAIYAYFESKVGLFDAVYHRMVVETVESVPMDARDLPGYAGCLFDRYRVHPEVQRLTAWFQFERNSEIDPPAIARAARDKVAKLRAAQDEGAIAGAIAPEHLLALIQRMATVGVYSSPETGRAEKPTRAMRAALVDGVRKLVEP